MNELLNLAPCALIVLGIAFIAMGIDMYKKGY